MWKKILFGIAVALAIVALIMTGRRNDLSSTIGKLKKDILETDANIDKQKGEAIDEYQDIDADITGKEQEIKDTQQNGQKDFDAVDSNDNGAADLNEFMGKRRNRVSRGKDK